MCRYKYFVGISTCSQWFEAALIRKDNMVQTFQQRFTQNEEGCRKMEAWLQLFNITSNDDILFCMELSDVYHTGICTHLIQYNAAVTVRMNQSGKWFSAGDYNSVPVSLARYAMRYRKKVKCWQPTLQNTAKLEHLVLQRSNIVTAISKLIAPIQELRNNGYEDDARQAEKIQRDALQALQKTQQLIETLIRQAVRQDEQESKEVTRIHPVKQLGVMAAFGILQSYKKLLQA